VKFRSHFPIPGATLSAFKIYSEKRKTEEHSSFSILLRTLSPAVHQYLSPHLLRYLLFVLISNRGFLLLHALLGIILLVRFLHLQLMTAEDTSSQTFICFGDSAIGPPAERAGDDMQDSGSRAGLRTLI
jgi:hypothetical protein